MRLSVESTTFDNKLNIWQFIVKCSTFYAQTHVDPRKIRALVLNLLVLEVCLEFGNKTGTIEKLCVSTTRYTTCFVFPTSFQFEIRRKLQKYSLKNAKLPVRISFLNSS